MIKHLQIIAILLFTGTFLYAQEPSLCKDQNTIIVDGGTNLDWYSVSTYCEGYASQSTCDANPACVWLEQICVPNSVPEPTTEIDTNLCEQFTSSEECGHLYTYGCWWQDGVCIQAEGLKQIYLGNSSNQTLPSGVYNGKFIVSDNGTDLYPFTFSELNDCPTTCESSAVIDTSVCSAFEVPSGHETYSVSGIYYDTIPNSQDCDSILTINLTVNPALIGNIEVSSICRGDVGTVNVSSTRPGYDYSLLHDNGGLIDGPKKGNGDLLTFNTQTVDESEFNRIDVKPGLNTALDFDGINDKVSVSGINLDTSFTIELWAKRASSNTNDVMFLYGQTVNDDGLHCAFLANGDLRFGFYFDALDYSAGSIATDGLWHHYAFVYDDAQLQKSIYIDGNLVQTGASNDFIGRNHDFDIGVSFGGVDNWDGNIDDLKIWSKARSQSEIEASLTECLAGNEMNLLAYFDFTESADASILRNIAQGENGLLENFDLNNAWVSSSVEGTCSRLCSAIEEVLIEVNQPTSSNITREACKEFESPSGLYTWTSSGFYNDTIQNNMGCDSVISINLTIHSIDTSVSVTLPGLVSNEQGASYQWIDCNNGFEILQGETNASFTASQNGSYAVELTKNGCIDTSNCQNVIITTVLENSFEDAFQVFPNPTTGIINLNFETGRALKVELKSITSQTLQTIEIVDQTSIEIQINEEPGVYLLEITDQKNNRSIIRVIKK